MKIVVFFFAFSKIPHYLLLILIYFFKRYMEEWKEIKGFEGYYEVSSEGKIRSKDRIIIQKSGRFHRRKGKILHQTPNKNNHYYQAMLIVHKHPSLKYVHRLVAEAFVENPNDYKFVTHINADITDNRASNLKWIKSTKRINY